jgi:hypothetical protein
MKKSIVAIQLALCCLILSNLVSCIDNDYNVDKINKDIVFSPDGLYIPVGNLDTMYLTRMIVEDQSGTTFVKTYENFFSIELYDYLVINKEGEDVAIGDISFESQIYYRVKNADPSGKLEVKIRALDAEGNDAGISFEPHILALGKQEQDQLFVFKIDQKDIIHIKNAQNLEFTFIINTRGFVISDLEESDLVLIKQMNIKSSGGIHLKF